MNIILTSDFLASDSLAKCSPAARLAFPRILVASTDPFGCFRWNVPRITGLAFPPDQDWEVTGVEVSAWLLEYLAAGILARWSEADHWYGFWVSYSHHNRIHGHFKRKTPIPPDHFDSLSLTSDHFGSLPITPRHPLSTSTSTSTSTSDSISIPTTTTTPTERNGSEAVRRFEDAIPIGTFQSQIPLLKQMMSVVQSHWSVPWYAPDVLANEVAALVRAGAKADRILEVWAFYVKTIHDPAKINVHWFVTNYNQHQAAEARHA